MKDVSQREQSRRENLNIASNRDKNLNSQY